MSHAMVRGSLKTGSQLDRSGTALLEVEYTAKTQYLNSKQMFPEKELHGLSTNFYIHVSER
jgi:hypothetical protein